ncbi:MAG: hypothetical protein VB092_05435 [Oscillospiraceae bacterium]|nr:hypothetical protein [Oscillospiraceae bacterium]
MRLKLAAFAALLLAFGIGGRSVRAQAPAPLSSTQLIENGFDFNDTVVTYGGEVVGDILRRGDGVWINVSDGANAIGVFIPAAEADKIENVGGYCVKGDTVALTGVFHRDCAQHGGDMDIHADAITITQRGCATQDAPSGALVLAAALLFPCALTAAAVVLKKRL